MTCQDKLKEASTFEIIKTVFGCYEFIKIAKDELTLRIGDKSQAILSLINATEEREGDE